MSNLISEFITVENSKNRQRSGRVGPDADGSAGNSRDEQCEAHARRSRHYRKRRKPNRTNGTQRYVQGGYDA